MEDHAQCELSVVSPARSTRGKVWSYWEELS